MNLNQVNKVFIQEWIFIICTAFISPMHRILTVGFNWACFGNTQERERNTSQRGAWERNKEKGSLTFSVKWRLHGIT